MEKEKGICKCRCKYSFYQPRSDGTEQHFLLKDLCYYKVPSKCNLVSNFAATFLQHLHRISQTFGASCLWRQQLHLLLGQLQNKGSLGATDLVAVLGDARITMVIDQVNRPYSLFSSAVLQSLLKPRAFLSKEMARLILI